MTELFKDGDKAMLVMYPQWSGARGFREVTIGKVHKTGRLTLEGSKTQYRRRKGCFGEADYFEECGYSSHERLYPWSADLASEIRAERVALSNRVKLNQVGDALSRMRDTDKAAWLWEMMPDELKALAETAQK